MRIRIIAFHNVEYDTSFDEDDTNWDIDEAIDKFNDICLPDENKIQFPIYFEELNRDTKTVKVVDVSEYYLKMGNQKSIYRYMQNEPIFVLEYDLEVNESIKLDESEIIYIGEELINFIFDNLNTNTVYVHESGVTVQPNFGLDGYYETSHDYSDDEGEVSFNLDHRDNIEIKRIKEVK